LMMSSMIFKTGLNRTVLHPLSTLFGNDEGSNKDTQRVHLFRRFWYAMPRRSTFKFPSADSI
jgi:hypothetical protein